MYAPVMSLDKVDTLASLRTVVSKLPAGTTLNSTFAKNIRKLLSILEAIVKLFGEDMIGHHYPRTRSGRRVCFKANKHWLVPQP